ncbi:formyltetrahydrofolate deformylase [Marinomonas sp. C2222]|uniref:Formyltetrahydrofolate deformylase n=1 Tax=Marinomonas sargassi TaxID=2984494 RepID=A0ABT2YQN2_9GAMM|nr:formyltetrahydrofolate deformylase [Marinomonas sargassi]MCV2402166.1 formyltetrahydrofolate deformylase [Marinomonas sargassi]
MKLKLTPTQNLCVGFLESGFELIELDEQFFFVKGDKRQKVLPKTLTALIDRGALSRTDRGEYLLTDEFIEHRKSMCKKGNVRSMH